VLVHSPNFGHGDTRATRGTGHFGALLLNLYSVVKAVK